MNLFSIFSNIDYTFSLDSMFDINTFKNSVEKISTLIDIPIYIKNIDDIVVVLNIEIYIIISNGVLQIICSHIYYDASSIFTILNLIDTLYNEKEITIPINVNSNIKENKNNLSSLVLNYNTMSTIFGRKEKLDKDLSESNKLNFVYKTTNVCKTIDIINEFQELFEDHNMLILVNSRKTLKLDKNAIGCYLYEYNLKKGDKHFLYNLKQCKDINDYYNSYINNIDLKNIIFKNIISINSYLNFIYPSFINELYPFYMIEDDNKKTIYISPKNKLGESTIYFSKSLMKEYNNLKI
jgi:hypothetical protein